VNSRKGEITRSQPAQDIPRLFVQPIGNRKTMSWPSGKFCDEDAPAYHVDPLNLTRGRKN